MLEFRDNPLDRCESKFAADEQGVFEGYASVFNSNDVEGDTVLPGAFKESLGSRWPAMFLEHDPRMSIGKWVKLTENKTGLKARGEFTPGNTNAQNAYASVKHGAITGLSIGFRAKKVELKNPDDPFGGRFIAKVDLVEVSVVSMPAEDKARITAAKAEIQTIESLKDAELFLRDAGQLSRSMATCFVSRFKAICQRDADGALVEEINELKAQLARATKSAQLRQLLNKYDLRGVING